MTVDTVYTCPNCTTIGAGIKVHCSDHGGNIVMPTQGGHQPMEFTNEELAALAADTNVTSVKDVDLPEDGENLTTKVLYKVARAQGALRGAVRKVTPTTEGVFSKTEDALVFGLTNPVTSGVKAGAVVLTNPFRKDRKSAREVYGQGRRYSNKVNEIDHAVRACETCDAPWGVSTVFKRAGRVGVYSGTVQERDTFCEEHCSDALKAQDIVKMAKGL